MTPTGLVVAALLAVGLSLQAPPAGAAGVGTLRYASCLESSSDEREFAACRDVNGVGGVSAVAVSRGGRSLYVVGYGGSISSFHRSSRTGAVKFLGCFETPGYANDPICPDVSGMSGADELRVSRDGRFVFVAADGALISFRRDRSSGRLAFVRCYDGAIDDPYPECRPVRGLDDAYGLTESPDGRWLYLSAGGNFGTNVLTFARKRRGSGLRSVRRRRFRFATLAEMAISPDGRSLYATASDSNALVVLRRERDTGRLDYVSCRSLDGTDAYGHGGCLATTGLSSAIDVAVSADGRSVYAVSSHGAIVSFRRARSGSLTLTGCLADWRDLPPGCESTKIGLGGAWSVISSGDGRSVYVAGGSIIGFKRNRRSGRIRFRQCFDAYPGGKRPRCPGREQLRGTLEIALSPGGRDLYAAAGVGVLARFKRKTGR